MGAAAQLKPLSGHPAPGPAGGRFALPGPIGTEGSPVPLALQRIVAKVNKDWVPPTPRSTPEIVVGGTTLQRAADELNRLPEWGEGGGMLRADRIPVGTSTEVTVSLHANLVMRLPRWSGYARASSAARVEWDRMWGKLRIHEQRHMEIAVEEADGLANDLIGREIGEIAAMVTSANRELRRRQDELDADTENGAKEAVRYGDVTLDVSIT